MSQFTTPILAKLQQALTAHRQGQLDVAEPLYREILAANPQHFDSTHLLGLIHIQRGQTDDGIALITKAVGIDNRNAPAYSNLASALRTAGRLEDALAAAGRAVTLQTDNADAQYNRALILLDLKRYEEALPGFRKATALAPAFADAHMNLGITLQALERLDEALISLTQANTLRPHHANTLHNLGHLYQRLRRLPDAAQAFKHAIAVDSRHAEAHVGLSECLLQMGDYPAGWREYEWRWNTPLLAPHKRSFTKPAWTGAEDPAGKTILVYAEQGLGDSLLGVRYLQQLRARGAKVILDVPPVLKRLLDGVGGTQVFATGESLPDFDMHCPLLSLPFLLNTGGDFGTVPYLAPPQAAADLWRDRLGARKGLRCALVWSASALTRGSGIYRSMPVTFLKRLAEIEAEFIGLQTEINENDRAAIAGLTNVKNVGPDLRDFTDTAGVMANVDLVITVDTATAHLAGALGKPALVLLAYHCDWRWQMGSSDPTVTPWYPNTKLIRQPKLHDWDAVMDQVVAELRTRT